MANNKRERDSISDDIEGSYSYLSPETRFKELELIRRLLEGCSHNRIELFDPPVNESEVRNMLTEMYQTPLLHQFRSTRSGKATFTAYFDGYDENYTPLVHLIREENGVGVGRCVKLIDLKSSLTSLARKCLLNSFKLRLDDIPIGEEAYSLYNCSLLSFLLSKFTGLPQSTVSSNHFRYDPIRWKPFFQNQNSSGKYSVCANPNFRRDGFGREVLSINLVSDGKTRESLELGCCILANDVCN
jgi:hypothetical protein